MITNIVKVTARECRITSRLGLSYIPIIFIFLVLAIVTGGVVHNLNRLLLLCTTLNAFFALIYFINVFLQQSKDREMQYFASLPIDRRDIIAGKTLYIGLVSLMVSGIIHLLAAVSTRAFLICLNSFFFNGFIATVVGMMFLSLFLFQSFENLMSYSQYVRVVVILGFMAAVYLLRFDISAWAEAFDGNPVLPIILYTAIIYVVYRLIVKGYEKKRSYL